MKQQILLFTIIVCAISLNAQDLIVLRDATEIESKVLEITETNVSYKKWDNLDGPVFSISRDKVFFIRFANGTKEVFFTSGDSQNTSPQQKNAESVKPEPSPFWQNRPFINGVFFSGYVDFMGFMGYSYGGAVTVSMGARIFDYAYTGARFGLAYDPNAYYYCGIPVQLDLRGYFPINTNVYPYIQLAFGAYLSVEHQGVGVYNLLNVGAGFDIKRFSVGLGYRRLTYSDNYFFLNIGVKFK